MADEHRIPLSDGRTARIVFSDASDGDYRVLDPVPGLEGRRRAIVDAPWSWLRQVHGAETYVVTHPGQHAGCEGDALLTTTTGCPISVTTADCAPLVLVADRGLAVVHAGWRGLVAGVVEATAKRLRAAAGEPSVSLLGPCIDPAAYEFGDDALSVVVARYGTAVAARTADGRPAHDVAAAVAGACGAAGWPVPDRPACTSDPRWYSHRTRADKGRQVAVGWLTVPGESGGNG